MVAQILKSKAKSEFRVHSILSSTSSTAITTVASFGVRHAGSALHLINRFVNAASQVAAFSAQARSIRCSTALTASCLLFACSVCIDLSNDVDHFHVPHSMP